VQDRGDHSVTFFAHVPEQMRVPLRMAILISLPQTWQMLLSLTLVPGLVRGDLVGKAEAQTL
jgi:hypothetical protein